MSRKAIVVLTALMVIAVIGCGKPDKSAQGYWDAGIACYQDQDFKGCVKEYENLIKFYPEDSLAVPTLFAMSEIYKNNLNDLPEAIKIYERIIEKYPTSEKAPNALFMIGYMYANEMKDLAKAKETYTKFIEKYPDHILVPSAQWELENLGKSLDEIPELKDIKKK